MLTMLIMRWGIQRKEGWDAVGCIASMTLTMGAARLLVDDGESQPRRAGKEHWRRDMLW